MHINEIIKLLETDIRDTQNHTVQSHLNHCDYVQHHMREAAEQLRKGNLELPWVAPSITDDGDDNLSDYTVNQPIADLDEVGTPIDPHSGERCDLDLEFGFDRSPESK